MQQLINKTFFADFLVSNFTLVRTRVQYSNEERTSTFPLYFPYFFDAF